MGDHDGEYEPWTHVVSAGPWPERIGRRCRLVPDPGTGVYPFDKAHRTTAVVLIEDDPHNGAVFSFGPSMTDEERGWTCVMDPADLSPSAASKEATNG